MTEQRWLQKYGECWMCLLRKLRLAASAEASAAILYHVAAKRLEAVGLDHIDEIGRAVPAPKHERHGRRSNHQRGDAPQRQGAPPGGHAGCTCGESTAGRATGFSTIGQCSRAETIPSAIE